MLYRNFLGTIYFILRTLAEKGKLFKDLFHSIFKSYVIYYLLLLMEQ